MKRALLFILSFVFVFLAFAPAASACTIFTASDESAALFGNNEDWLEKDTFIWFLPVSPGKYGRACVGFENAHPQGGFNEAGLALDWMAYQDATAENLAPASNTKQNYPGDINDALLSTCATVDDVIAFYQQYNDPNLGYASLLAVDKTGASVLISWDKSAGDIRAEKTTSGLQPLGYGAKYVEFQYTKNPSVTTDAFRVMLDAAKQKDMTLYSNIFDLKTGDITLYHAQNFEEAVHLNLAEELQKGPHLYSIPSLFTAQLQMGGDVLNPATLLPLYVRILLFALAALMLLNIAFMVLSLLRCTHPTAIKKAVRYLGIVSSASALALLYFLYTRWYFLANYGFAILGPVLAILPWLFVAVTLVQFVCCMVALKQGNFEKHARIAYFMSSVLLLLIAAGMVAAGVLG